MPKDFNADKPSRNPAADNSIINIQNSINKAKLCLEKASQRQKYYADLDRADLPAFQVGELAWLSSKQIALKVVGTRKLLPRWLGPFEVTALNGLVTYSLDIPAHYNTHTNFHVSMLKHAHDNACGVVWPLPVVVEGLEDLEYEVETILAHRPEDMTGPGNKVSYLVKWVGYSPMANSWEPQPNLLPRAKGALSENWKQVVTAVQAVQPNSGSDVGLAPSNQSVSAARGRGAGQIHGRRRQAGLRPINKTLKK